MHGHEYSYVEDKIQVASSIKMNQAIMFLCALFSLFGLAYPFIWLGSGIAVDSLTLADVVMIAFNIIFGLGYLCMMINILIVIYFRQSVLSYINDVSIMLVLSIPGMLTLFCVAASSSIGNDALISTYILLFLLACFVFVFLGYIIKKHRLEIAKKFRKSKSYTFFVFALAALMLALIGLNQLPIDNMKQYSPIILISIICMFYSIWIGHYLLASQLIKAFRQEFIYFENIPFNASIHFGREMSQRRLIIPSPVYYETALDVLEEFGFVREKVDQAIHAKQPIYTFIEGTRLNFAFLRCLLERLDYEDVAFIVEEEQHGQWVELGKAFYDDINARNIHYELKESKDEEKDGFGTKLLKFITLAIAGPIYIAWTCIFPVNYFRPVSMMDEATVARCYESFTHYEFRTFYHGLFMILCVVLYLVSPAFQVYYMNLTQSKDYILYIVFGLVFVVELGLFPLYIRRLKRVVDHDIRIHNYSKKILWGFVIMYLFRMYRHGWVTSLAQIFLLIVAVECAKFVVIVYRYIRYLPETEFGDADHRYMFIEKNFKE